MTFREQLKELRACQESSDWVKNKTIEEAWETCKNSEWMLSFLTKIDLDLTDPLCDIAERVLYLIQEDNRFVCSNIISAARRRANQDELTAVRNAVNAAVNSSWVYVDNDASATTAYWVFSTAANIAHYATNKHSHAAYSAAAYTARAVRAAARNAYCTAARTDYDAFSAAVAANEQKKQCDILRKYFTIDQVKEAFNKLVNN